jgi:glucose-6-phosphate 1-epimerase
MLPDTDVRTLTSDGATLTVADHGAHVLSWVLPDGTDVLFVSERTASGPGTAIRGGVPICFPWFGAGVSGDRAPAHGLVRLLAWEQVAANDSATLVHELSSEALTAEQAAETGAFHARHEATLGPDSLTMTLTVTNTDAEKHLTFEEALHTYLAVDDLAAARVTGLDGASYVDKAADAERGPHRQSGDVVFDREIDRVYSVSTSIELVGAAGGRTLRLTPKDAANAVTWNPDAPKAERLGDLGDDEYLEFVCVETGNVLDDAVELAPGASHTFGVTISVV